MRTLQSNSQRKGHGAIGKSAGIHLKSELSDIQARKGMEKLITEKMRVLVLCKQTAKSLSCITMRAESEMSKTEVKIKRKRFLVFTSV